MKRAGRRYMGKKKQSKAAKEALQKLDEFLKAAEAEPVTFLAGLWSDQQNAITYKELRAAVMSGALNEKTLRAWEQDYAKLVNEKLAPVWQKAMQAASDALSAKYPGYFYDITAPSVQRWIAEHGAQLVTQIGQQQRGAIAAMLARGASGWGPDELAYAIRPCIGLTKPQAMANLNYYQHVKQSLLENNPAMRQSTAETHAREAAAKYAERQHRGRARTIANNELATAYNRGAYEGVKQAQAQGYMGKVIARLSTAGPDACPICAALEGTVVELDRVPPLHVGCRCAVLYEETEPPALMPTPEKAIDAEIRRVTAPPGTLPTAANDFEIFPEERGWIGSKIERGALFDANGAVIIEATGTATRVDFSGVAPDVFENAVFSHWHPKPFAPSSRDFYRLWRRKMHALRTATVRGVYVLRAVSGWSNVDFATNEEFRGRYKQAGEEIEREVGVELAAGRLTEDEANELALLLIAQRIAEKYGIEFYLVPWEDSE